ncbi:MAG: 3-isopropylmalate dehydrogenase [Christensenellaceae bacterium]|jgi:3-isopropylmalate dehydrogenase|nr:3-isopropylmalate dehydrogenase [Christensenellaceae bacterium]
MKKYKIALLPGDGIGPEIIESATQILQRVAQIYKFQIEMCQAPIGGHAIDTLGEPLPNSTLELCKSCNAVLMGAVGGPKWDLLPGNHRPEAGLLKIRAGLGLFANLRPAVVYNALKNASPLKDSALANGVDIMVIRELTGGIYFGQRKSVHIGNKCVYAYDTEEYTVDEIVRIAHVAFNIAIKRRKRVCSIDKANVLESSRLWRQTVADVAKEYRDVELSTMYVDNAAMQLVRNPGQFDVILTNNIFGDILSDEASQITGSIGMLPSASLGKGKLGLYEPIHGSAPDIAGKNIANPMATILSVAMMLRFSLDECEAAERIEESVTALLELGYRTADITSDGIEPIRTTDVTKKILELLNK